MKALVLLGLLMGLGCGATDLMKYQPVDPALITGATLSLPTIRGSIEAPKNYTEWRRMESPQSRFTTFYAINMQTHDVLSVSIFEGQNGVPPSEFIKEFRKGFKVDLQRQNGELLAEHDRDGVFPPHGPLPGFDAAISIRGMEAQTLSFALSAGDHFVLFTSTTRQSEPSTPFVQFIQSLRYAKAEPAPSAASGLAFMADTEMTPLTYGAIGFATLLGIMAVVMARRA